MYWIRKWGIKSKTELIEGSSKESKYGDPVCIGRLITKYKHQ